MADGVQEETPRQRKTRLQRKRRQQRTISARAAQNDQYRQQRTARQDAADPAHIRNVQEADRHRQETRVPQLTHMGDVNYYINRAILSPHNREVEKFNKEVLNLIQQDEQFFLSADAVTDPAGASLIPVE
ncbi:hypothetical protein PsorP6_016163 [Peronosclerospora sorghi]|uniref:Uncharacterized protein n=1 Tax=Peronosclerospora sorghi TaxID=230839 RepID=A0ACC0VJW4_9STRA|nr:hypothetical protein PsorP6_016163 [Peronosclerospora sorghi]